MSNSHSQTINSTQKAIDLRKAERSILPWLMWCSAALFYFYQFILRVSPSIMTDELMGYLNIGSCALGALTSFYYWGYVLAQIPVGLSVDQLGVRRPLVFACALCVIGCLLFISSPSILVMGIGRFLMGLGSAFGLLSSLKIATVWFPPHRFGLFLGLTIFLGTTGAVNGGAPLAKLVQMIGWQQTILYLAVASGILGLVAWTVIRDQQLGEKKPLSQISHSITEALKVIIENPRTWLYGLYGGLMYVPLSGFADLWGTQFIKHLYTTKSTVAAGSVLTFYVGVAIGTPFFNFLSDKIKSHLQIMRLSALLGPLAFIYIIYCPNIPFEWTYTIFFTAGLAVSGQFLAFSCVTEINDHAISGTATASHNMLCMTSGILFQPAIGWLMDLSWDGGYVNGVKQYLTSDYQMGLFLIPLCMVLAFVTTFWMKETYPK